MERQRFNEGLRQAPGFHDLVRRIDRKFTEMERMWSRDFDEAMKLIKRLDKPSLMTRIKCFFIGRKK